MPSKFNRVFNSKPVLFLILMILIWVTISVVRVSYQRYLLNKETERIKREVQDLEKQNSQLQEYLEYLRSDSFVEKEARSKLNLKKEGESVVVVPGGDYQETPASQTAPLSGVSEDGEQKKKPWWWKWWDYFFE